MRKKSTRCLKRVDHCYLKTKIMLEVNLPLFVPAHALKSYIN